MAMFATNLEIRSSWQLGLESEAVLRSLNIVGGLRAKLNKDHRTGNRRVRLT